jgi:hypothetical protein
MNTASIRSFLLRSPRTEEAAPVEYDAAEMGTAFGLDLSFAAAMAETPLAGRAEVERSPRDRRDAEGPTTPK